MVATAYEQGATLLNYVEVTGLTKTLRDLSTESPPATWNGNAIRANAKVVINATGAFSDQLRLKPSPQPRR